MIVNTKVGIDVDNGHIHRISHVIEGCRYGVVSQYTIGLFHGTINISSITREDCSMNLTEIQSKLAILCID